jgi:hypothetical protein
MQYLRDIQNEVFIIVDFGVKFTNLLITDIGLLNSETGKIQKRCYNAGSYGYYINGKFKSERKLPKYPFTKIIHIKDKLPF